MLKLTCLTMMWIDHKQTTHVGVESKREREGKKTSRWWWTVLRSNQDSALNCSLIFYCISSFFSIFKHNFFPKQISRASNSSLFSIYLFFMQINSELYFFDVFSIFLSNSSIFFVVEQKNFANRKKTFKKRRRKRKTSIWKWPLNDRMMRSWIKV